MRLLLGSPSGDSNDNACASGPIVYNADNDSSTFHNTGEDAVGNPDNDPINPDDVTAAAASALVVVMYQEDQGLYCV